MAPLKIVQTTIKPSALPPGILDLENQDSFKTDAGSSAKPKPPPPLPSSNNMGKPIVKDLDKENGGDSGELIE